MKPHLIIILIVIIFVPVWLTGKIYQNIIVNEQDAAHYRFERNIQDRLQAFIGELDGRFTAIQAEIVTALNNELPLKHRLVIDQVVIDPGRRADSDYTITLPSVAGRIIHRLNENSGAGKAGEAGWYSALDRNNFRLFYWSWMSEEQFFIAEIDREKLFGEMTENLGKLTRNNNELITISDDDNHYYHQGELQLVSSAAKESFSVPLNYPLQFFRAWYFTAEIPDNISDLRLLVMAAGITLMLLGAYFFREHMRVLDDTKRKVSFVNLVSHELKTPLTNIKMYTELLAGDLGEDHKSMEKLRVIDSECNRLSQLIHNVLSFSNPDALKPNPVATDIGALIERVLKGFELSLLAKEIRVECECHVKEMSVDPNILEQVLINLISNVEKYAAEGKYLGIRAEDKEGRLHIKVSDKGSGVPEKLKKMVFQPFVRGADHVSEGVSGTGIGLSLARDLVEKHGGRLIISDTSEGACFEVIL
jgi:signal transduction histidine kinase